MPKAALKPPLTEPAIPVAGQPSAGLLAEPRYSVPLEDLAEFHSLPEARRTEVQFTLALLARLRGADNLGAAAKALAGQHRHQMRGCSAESLLRKHYLYAGAQGDWRALVKGYRGPNTQPPEFVELVRKLAEDNHRSMAEAFNLLRRTLWPSGQPIPGYGSWVEHHAHTYPERPLPKTCPRDFFPAGWSRRNLFRMAPNKGARVLFQRGLAAAKKHFPSVKRDPSALRPLELLVIDDFELDCLCVFPGDKEHKPQIAPVAGLLVIDVATRRKLHWGLGPRVTREERQKDGTVRTVRLGIRRVDVQTMLHGLFSKYGLPDYPVTILCENATASVSPELELALSTLFEGRVRVERTGLIVNHRTLANGFCERGGKPWEKGWIEAAFNGLWNVLGAMPGYKGSNQRLNGPAAMDDAIAYTKLLLGQGERALNLPPEQLARLRLPFPSPEAVERAFAWACIESDRRTEHKYLGFGEVTEFRLAEGEEPRPFSDLALVPVERQAAAIISQRPESPLERWTRFFPTHPHAPLRPVPPAVLALLLLTPKRVTWRNHQISFAHDKTGYTYIDDAGKVTRGLPDGTELLGYFDATEPEQLHLADLRGAYVGTLQRLGGRHGMVDIRDQDALKAEAARTATVLNREVAAVRARHVEQDAQLAQDRAHNAAVVAEHKAKTADLTAAERIALAAAEAAAQRAERKAHARAMQRTAAKMDDAEKAEFLPRPEPRGASGPAESDNLGDYL